MESLGKLDLAILHLLNGLVGTDTILDLVVVFVSHNDLVKGVPVLMVWWGLWSTGKATDGQARSRLRARLLSTLLVSVVAIAVGRVLALTLPFRLRPMHDPQVATLLPTDLSPTSHEGWNSLPSDHAVLFFALASCVFLIRRLPGVLLLLHAAVIVVLPRIYLGLHYPSDAMLGAAIGILVAFVFLEPGARMVMRSGLLGMEACFGYLFYPALFLVTFQAASMFASLRDLISAIHRFLVIVAAGFV